MSRNFASFASRFLFAAVLSLGFFADRAHAILFSNFNEALQNVNGYQDDFTGGTLNAGWNEIGSDAGTNFVLSGSGTLLMNPATGDPNKLVYNGPAYSATNQNVLALIRVTTPGTGDGFRGGVATLADASSAQGINLLFRANGNNGSGDHFNLLNDAIAWGPASTDPGNGGDTWVSTNSLSDYKWLRVVTDGTTHQVKLWDAGATPEPAAFDFTWTQGGRSGLAGLATNSGGSGVFEVDYILIQAAGLPLINAVPEPSTFALATFGLMGLVRIARRRKA